MFGVSLSRDNYSQSMHQQPKSPWISFLKCTIDYAKPTWLNLSWSDCDEYIFTVLIKWGIEILVKAFMILEPLCHMVTTANQRLSVDSCRELQSLNSYACRPCILWDDCGPALVGADIQLSAWLSAHTQLLSYLDLPLMSKLLQRPFLNQCNALS